MKLFFSTGSDGGGEWGANLGQVIRRSIFRGFGGTPRRQEGQRRDRIVDSVEIGERAGQGGEEEGAGRGP